MESAKSVITSKLTILPECKSASQNVQWIQFHPHQFFQLWKYSRKAFKLAFCYRILRGSVELDYKLFR